MTGAIAKNFKKLAQNRLHLCYTYAMKNVLVMISPMDEARVGGVARYAHEHGWMMMIQDWLGHNPLVWNGDGVIATLRKDPSSYDTIRTLMRRHIPIVDITINRPRVNVPRVMSDHVGLGRLAAEHFANRNFKNIAWFSIGWGNVHNLRFKGLSEKFPAMKWVLSDELPKKSQGDWNTFYGWIAAKLMSAPKPLAVLTYNEADAARLLAATERAGILVPEEIAILSIGNNPLICENQSISLSSIDQNLDRGGYEAAALLQRLMDGKRPPKTPILIPPAGVVLRRSTDVIAVSDPIVRQGLKYIGENLASSFGTTQIADSLGVTHDVLHKHFVAELGRSAGREILRQRLGKVKLLLRNTRMPISEIAAATGFCTPSHLSNAFRDATGSTPREWRKV
ncbi:MAG: substrate-binding domain-containing protein [Bacteroidales bacterium]|nr:substrate-binding domain-containing protein [Bacteroidales bacterium]